MREEITLMGQVVTFGEHIVFTVFSDQKVPMKHTDEVSRALHKLDCMHSWYLREGSMF
jgi:hypothetical protein